MLVLRAQLGDRDAFDKLYCSISPNLLRFLDGIVQNVATAEDVLQEVLLLIYRKIRWLREPEHFRAWAYRLAARAAIRMANRGRHEAQLTDDEWNAIRHSQAEPLVESRILGEAAMREIAALPPASRAILSLHYMEGMEIREAAALLDIPVGTAKSRLSFGIQRLRERLGVRIFRGGRE